MSMFKLSSSGSWWLHSEKDPRWNKQGSGYCGGFNKPDEVQEWCNIFTEKYGDPPDDLEWGYMKD